MPALLIEAGFIDNEKDNEKFDAQFNEIAAAIAEGILETLDMGSLTERPLYKVQVGAYEDKDNADRLVSALQARGFDPYVIYQNGMYKVQVGAYANLSNAAAMENRLRDAGYPTFITT